MKPYSHDLRVRIFSYYLTHSIKETARIFQVSPNTVFLLKKLFIETGSLNPREGRFRHPYLVSPEGEIFLLQLLREENDLTLEELCDRYEQTYGVRIGVSTMFDTLKRLNITRKKKIFSDPKKGSDDAQAKKEKYNSQLEAIDPEQRLYLDETGSCLNMSPLYGRSYQGERAYDKKPTYPAVTVSTVAILSKQGMKAEYTYEGSLNAEVFIAYLESFILPILKDGQTLIMDRHPVHRAKSVQNFFDTHKIKYLFLPPYSPELNPIEEAFSKIKQYIKKQKARTLDTLLNVLNDAFKIITYSDASGYFDHASEF